MIAVRRNPMDAGDLGSSPASAWMIIAGGGPEHTHDGVGRERERRSYRPMTSISEVTGGRALFRNDAAEALRARVRFGGGDAHAYEPGPADRDTHRSGLMRALIGNVNRY